MPRDRFWRPGGPRRVVGLRREAAAMRAVAVVALVLLFAALVGRAYDQALAGEPALGATHSAPTATDGVYLLAPVVSSAARKREQASPARIFRASWPTREAMRWQPPRGFLRQAFCVHRHESVDWYRAYVDWRGYPSDYSGGMQFTLSTWRRAGGSGHPHQWRPREQVYRAWRIWRLYRTAWRPGSWQEWGTAGRCGLA